MEGRFSRDNMANRHQPQPHAAASGSHIRREGARDFPAADGRNGAIIYPSYSLETQPPMAPWLTNPHAGPAADTPGENVTDSLSRFHMVNQLHPSDVEDMPEGVRGAMQTSDNPETQAAFAKIWTHFMHETDPTRAQQMMPMPQLPLPPAQYLPPPPAQLDPPPPAELLTEGNTSNKLRKENNNEMYGNLCIDEPPVNVQPPMDINLTVFEIMTFNPMWLHIPKFTERTVRNGYKRRDLTKMHLLSQNLLTKDNMKRDESKIQKTISFNGLMLTGRPTTGSNDDKWDSAKFARDKGPQNDLTANSWQLRCKYDNGTKKAMDFGHWPLARIYNRVNPQNWPTGGDRGLYTQCLEFARQHPNLQLDTSHIGWIIQSRGLQTPKRKISGSQFDDERLDHFRRTVPDPQQ
ncbi:hypothetical protein KC363_g5782 [Hortaea werneckii]|nr:hypothetical protein KC361_g1512 [Hortaea werneckii]KAI6883896.1 hypothetical protein KC325_g4729 [Hortaea werneckii]KAI6992934.1 hypothetical protein KC359_g5406 [Hortaea werneckii]KAI7145246.1 hypothetical protein KC344_g4647 [Hortaea werneckii]KAI7173673.1 hypothetical protein KC360_g4739 [Hortaea werneckii]